MRKVKWLIYTVAVGLLPFFARFFIYITLSSDISLDFLLNEGDIIAFGLVLNISNINELEHENQSNQEWKTIRIGSSIILIVVFAMLLTLSTLYQANESTLCQANSEPKLSPVSLRISAFILSIATFVFSYSIYDNIPNEK